MHFRPLRLEITSDAICIQQHGCQRLIPVRQGLEQVDDESLLPDSTHSGQKRLFALLYHLL
jgi:hypothetical protein